MEKWQYNSIFIIALGGVVFVFLAPIIPGMGGLLKNPASVAPMGLLLTYVLTQKSNFVKKDDKETTGEKKEDANNDDH